MRLPYVTGDLLLNEFDQLVKVARVFPELILPTMRFKGTRMEDAWLMALLGKAFFGACESHVSLRRNECNVFCCDCLVSICQHCLPCHPSHWLLQIRRYVYHDVIRLEDIQKLVDVEHVQAYIINSAKVVFLNQRPQTRPARGVGSCCKTCDRALQDGYKFCSVACKVDWGQKNGARSIIGRVNADTLTAKLGHGSRESEQLSPNSVLPEEPTLSCPVSLSSSESTANDALIAGRSPLSSAQSVRKPSALLSKPPKSAHPSTQYHSHPKPMKPSMLVSSASSSGCPDFSVGFPKSPTYLKWPKGIKSLAMRPSMAAAALSTSPPFSKSSHNPSKLRSPPTSLVCKRLCNEGCSPCPFPIMVSTIDDDGVQMLHASKESSRDIPLPKRRKGNPQRSPIL